MEIKLLGPLTAHDQGVSVVPSAAKPRQILALLALQAEHVVTVPTLMAEIWGADSAQRVHDTADVHPPTAPQDRGHPAGEAARGAKDILVTQFGGYLLRVQPGQIDVQEFEQLVADGRSAYDATDYRTASHLLGKALALWQGPALVDVRTGSMLELEVLRLEENRMAALERRIDADLRLGRHAEVVPELRVLTARHPMHERFCAQLMLALHRSGGSWRALEAYQRLRGALVSELGLEPSASLRQLHHAVLSGDTALDQQTAGVY